MALLNSTGRKFTLILIELGFIFITGIIKHFLSGIPAELMIGSSVTAVGLYFGVNYVQKREEINAQKNHQ